MSSNPFRCYCVSLLLKFIGHLEKNFLGFLPKFCHLESKNTDNITKKSAYE
jgi:hypothetical protein